MFSRAIRRVANAPGKQRLRRYATAPGTGPVGKRTPGSKDLPPVSKDPGLAKYNPWSLNFDYPWSVKVGVQALAYAVGIVLATNYVDSHFFVRSCPPFPRSVKCLLIS